MWGVDGMIIPVRCISCGKVLADKWEKFSKEVSKGQEASSVLDELGVTRYCCRSLMITHVDFIDEIAEYKKRLLPKEERGKK